MCRHINIFTTIHLWYASLDQLNIELHTNYTYRIFSKAKPLKQVGSLKQAGGKWEKSENNLGL